MPMRPKLVKSLAVVGAISLVAGFAGLLLGIGLLRSGFSARPEPGRFEAWMALKLRKLAVPSRYAAMRRPVVDDEKTFEQAMSHWADHCASCHANDGSGHTTMGKSMYPRPPDMREDRTQEMTDGELYFVINQGIRFSGMPAWGESGDKDKETWALVAFIRRLPRLRPDQVEAMKAMNPVSASAIRAKQDEDKYLSDEDQ